MKHLPIRLLMLMGLMGAMPIQPISTLLPTTCAHAQTADSGRVELQVNALQFFQNNEYFGQRVEGYTLPGFRLTPRVRWNVGHGAQFEVGADWIHFWGATSYPVAGSLGIMPNYSDTATTMHLRPWVRALFRIGDNWSVIMGNIETKGGHMLPLPLYNPERRYAADAETGVQILANYRHLQADVWVDWCDYIWSHSPHQERFVAGASLHGLIDLGESNSWWLTPQLDALGQHIGGQTLSYNAHIKNTFNLSAGIGVVHAPHEHWLMSIRCHAMMYSQRGNEDIPFSNGWGVYPVASVGWNDDLGALSIGYWHGHGFVPLLGSPLFSNVSVRDDLAADATRIFDNTDMLHASLRHTWQYISVCDLSVEGNLYYYLGHDADPIAFGIGVFINMSPKLTLLR